MSYAMETRMAEMGERVANLEARLDAQGQDLAEIRQSVVRLEDKMERRFQSVDDALRSLSMEMHVQFRWLIAGIAGASLTIIVAMFAKELLRP